MYTKEQLSEIVEQYIRSLDFPPEPESLYAPIGYSLESGGKRVRPLLTTMACNIYSDDIAAALPCAAAIEVFHNFTLLHDDIMDNAPVRRGRPSVWRRWGEDVAILSGDAMMIYSYQLLEKVAPSLLPRIFAVFNDTSMKVCEGQQYDMDFGGLEHVAMDEYLHMISLKTAALMAGATVMGAMVGGAGEEDCAALYTFAMELGVAFQIQDDLLDTYGSLATLGKNIGGDIAEGKKTYLAIAALGAADEKTRTRLAGIMHNREMLPEIKIPAVLDIYAATGARSAAEKAVAHYTHRALAVLDSLHAEPSRTEPMRQLALSLTKRIK